MSLVPLPYEFGNGYDPAEDFEDKIFKMIKNNEVIYSD